MRPTSIEIGNQYGALTVIGFAGLKREGAQNYRQYKCRCECGRFITTRGASLTGGNTKSCGCAQKRYAASLKGRPQCKAKPGDRWNRLTFVKWLYTKKKNAICEFRCVCGTVIVTGIAGVRHGNVKSCGCLGREKTSEVGKTYGPKMRLPDGVSSFNRLLRTYIRNAKQRNLSFLLTREEFRTLTTSPCFYCGIEPRQIISSPGGVYVYNGLDRLNSQQAYTLENVVPACVRCNNSKRDVPLDEYIAWIKRLFQNLPRLEQAARSAS